MSEPVTGLGAGEGLIVVPATDRLVAYESLHSRLEPLTPARILDTRPTGPQRGYTGAKPAAGATLLVDVLGQGGVPETHVSAAVLTVTAVQATRPGFVTAWPSGTPRPATSNLNLAATGETLANEVIVPIGSDGKIALRTSAGAHLVVDVTGYFTPVPSSARGRYTGVAPARVFDTRVAGLGGPTKPAGGSARTVPITGHGGIPDTGVGAVAVNLTATSTARDSYVTAWPSGSPKPLASSLNVAPGKTVAASAILPVGPDGAINLYTSGGSHLLVDVMGWFSDDTAVPGASGLFVPVAPVRVRDTRTGTRPAGGTAVQVPITATPSVFDATARSAVFNLTATQPAASGYLTAYPHGSSRPSSSNLNMSAPGQTIANLVVGTLGGDGATSVYTSTSSHVIVDLMGYFLP